MTGKGLDFKHKEVVNINKGWDMCKMYVLT